MASFEWNCPEPIGITQIDQQNAELDRMLHRLVDTLSSDPSGALPEYRLAQLIEQTSDHFRTEEEFLMAMGYPDLAVHRSSHERIVQRFQGMLLQMDAPDAPPLIDLVKEFTMLTLSHVETVDHAYAVWLEGK